MNRPSVTPFCAYRQFMIRTYGEPLYRIPVDFGFGCPHRRDDGSGGCTFCPADGSRSHHTLGVHSVSDQVRAGVEFARKRYGARRFMAYVQAFTGTFAPASRRTSLIPEASRGVLIVGRSSNDRQVGQGAPDTSGHCNAEGP